MPSKKQRAIAKKLTNDQERLKQRSGSPPHQEKLPVEPSKKSESTLLEKHIFELQGCGLDAAIARILFQNNINNIGDLVKKSEEEVLVFQRVGPASLKKIKAALTSLSLSLKT
jgi:DNA-directed RNA polymerase alpha subunit